MMVDLVSGSATRVDLDLQPDNITPYGSNGFITVGHTGIPMTGIEACRPDPSLPCAFPFAVAIIAPAAGRYGVDIIYAQDVGPVPGASVAVSWRSGLLVGTSFGDRITYVLLGQTDSEP